LKQPIFVTKPYLPPIDKYISYIKSSFERQTLTNNGPLLQELTQKLKTKLGVNNLLLVSNGTVALQIAYRIKNLANKKVITTPYTFAATSTALEWQGAKVVLADIDKASWNISPHSVEKLLAAKQGEAIVAVNLFGQPCELEKLENIAKKHQVPLIYDSAHALLSDYKDQNIYNYGDIHCISFHATKLFHSVEGGAIIFNNKSEYEMAKKLINFGIDENGNIEEAGINGKLSEIHAAMGLCVLDDIDGLVNERERSIKLYKQYLGNNVSYQKADFECRVQPIYMPVLFKTERELLDIEHALNKEGYFPRRYFMPQHYKFLCYSQQGAIDRCSQLANRVLCLPLMNGLKEIVIKEISEIILKVLSK